MRYRCFADHRRRPVGPDRFALWERWTGRGAMVSGGEGQRLSSCTAFATLSEHARRLAGTFGINEAQARAELEQRVKDGLLVGEEDLRAALTANAEPDPGASPIERIGIVTRGRPESLVRCVTGLRQHLEAHGRRATIVVCHHDEPATSLEGVTSIGRARRLAFADRLAAEGVAEPELLRWALAPDEPEAFVAGASRNALLLDALGEALAMVDDDTEATLLSTAASTRLRLASAHDPTERWYPDAEDELPTMPAAEGDLLGWHEQLLGRRLAALAANAELDGLDGELARRVQRGARVCTTQLGIAGDTGTGSLGHYLELLGPSRERLMATEEGYARAWANRRVVRAVTQPTVTDSGSMMTYGLALDLRSLVAPFPPVLRNADGIFGRVMRACSATYAAGWLPAAIAHRPPEARDSSFEAFLASLHAPAGNDLLGHLIAAAAPVASDDLAASLRHLGATLVAFARDADFGWDLRQRLARGRAGDIARLEAALLRHDHEPAWWAQDLRRAIMELDRAAMATAPLTISDLASGEPALREHVERYGRLLRLWPDIVAATTDLARGGERLSNGAAP